MCATDRKTTVSVTNDLSEIDLGEWQYIKHASEQSHEPCAPLSRA